MSAIINKTLSDIIGIPITCKVIRLYERGSQDVRHTFVALHGTFIRENCDGEKFKHTNSPIFKSNQIVIYLDKLRKVGYFHRYRIESVFGVYLKVDENLENILNDDITKFSDVPYYMLWDSVPLVKKETKHTGIF